MTIKSRLQHNITVAINLVFKCRGYSEKKIQENVECEIMHVVEEEARDSYRCAAEEPMQDAGCLPAALVGSVH